MKTYRSAKIVLEGTKFRKGRTVTTKKKKAKKKILLLFKDQRLNAKSNRVTNKTAS